MFRCKFFIPFLLVISFFIVMPAFGASLKDLLPDEFKARIPDEIKDNIKYRSGQAAMIAAEVMGVKEIMGKPISQGLPPSGSFKPPIKDVPIGNDPTAHENEPTIVANPKNKMNLVAGSHFYVEGDRYYIVAYYSFDAGVTWSKPIFMPGLSQDTSFADPVLTFAPDGSRVYFAYMDIKESFDPNPPYTYMWDWDIVVSFSDDGGKNWKGPFIALDGLPSVITSDPYSEELGFDYDKCWVGTHVPVFGLQSNSKWVYVTATRFDNFEPYQSNIAFTRSSNKGVTWSAPVLLESSIPYYVSVVQGSRPSGGLGNNVAVAWYNSAEDGWLWYEFKINVAYSPDNGQNWKMATATYDKSELSYYLGPWAGYHRWWGGMFPDIEIDPTGAAHIVYTHDPEEGVDTAEEGDIRYMTSPGPPYNKWSAPITLNDDNSGTAQGYAAIETEHGNKPTLHAIWEDHRYSADNYYYDIFYARKFPATAWSSNIRVSDASSASDYWFIGDYNDLACNNALAFGIWTDRRDQWDIFAYEDDVYGCKIVFGTAAPPRSDITLGKALPDNLKAQPMGIPDKTLAYQNYPNPFNPETLIPYQLSESADVSIKIYDIAGNLVKSLNLGRKEAGWYITKEKAAYWDGKNEVGEHIKSGIYFYEFKAGDFRSVNKMLIIE